MEYVCPNCGAAAGGQSVCSACGFNLDSLRELPTREEYEAEDVNAVREEFLAGESLGPGEPGSLVSRFIAGWLDTFIMLALPVAIVAVGSGTDSSFEESPVAIAAGVLYILL